MPNLLSSNPNNSKGRLYSEKEDIKNRSPFQRDRDRVIHSSAFRKLKQKTQVFIESESDYYRTRLTHTLEVSQISRSICRILNLNEDLGECIALTHDLGHPPFGHNGENALNIKMENHGGFNHNDQTLRIITFLEKKYPEFNGLNLTWESLEGIVKHNGKFKNEIPQTIFEYNKKHNLNLYKNPSLEAQVASIADDIAYNNHDIDDAYRAKLIDIDQLNEIRYFKEILNNINHKYKNLDDHILISELVRSSINNMIEDIVFETKNEIKNNKINSIENITEYPSFLVKMSNELMNSSNEIKIFLYDNVYNHKNLVKKREESEMKLSKLFDYYDDNFNILPNDWKNKIDLMSKERIVCDYIAGMTDRYATQKYEMLYV